VSENEVAQWGPSKDRSDASAMLAYQKWVSRSRGLELASYSDLWQWSIDNIEDFWFSIWEYFGLESPTPITAILSSGEMPGAQWFEGATINFAERALARDLESPALIAHTENAEPIEMSWKELRGQVGAVQRLLMSHGVKSGDRVVGYLPSNVASVVSLLACASIGAVWASCAPEYSAQGAADRFAQLEPVVLIASTNYRYGGKLHDRAAQVDELERDLPTLLATLRIDGGAFDLEPCEPEFASVPFGHPLWVLFSSGTTGRPKGMVHSHGGALLEMLKHLRLHADLGEGSRFFWFATTTWIVWNIQVAALLVGSTIVVYDGSPTYPDAGALFRIAERSRVTFLGVSPGYLTGAMQAGIEPGHDFDLRELVTIGSTGAPLPPLCYHWVYDALPHVWLTSITGGTDVASAFAGGVVTLPVRAGEIQAPFLGVALAAWNSEGCPVIDEVGELVVTKPMPSMPLYFWNDPDGSRYLSAYFDTFPGIWRHGDWMTVTPRGSVIIHGRSDATINRQGVRMGSAEIYEVVENLDFVSESLVLGIESDNGDYWMPLFVVLTADRQLDEKLIVDIKSALRSQMSPRHVPDDIIQVPKLPHTHTGKRMEVPIKRILQGTPIDQAANRAAVDDAASLDWFVDFAQQRVLGG
jgi:acetoacetyl-CoA synthetase